MVKPRNMEIVKDETAGEVKIHKLEYDKENETVKEAEDTNQEIINTPMGSTTVDITPGKKVTVIGKDGVFSISQKLNNGKVSLLGDEGLILFVEPNEIRNVK